MTTYNSNRNKDILLNTFSSFQQFCKKHDLHYIGAYGTMLGAVRHKGIIPWDDDIDVIMMRSDYNRFLSLASTLKGSNFEIHDYHTNGYYCSFAKYINTNTTLWEFEDRPYISGIFIDVFPVDEIANEDDFALKDQCQRAWQEVYYTTKPFSFKRLYKSIKHYNWTECKEELRLGVKRCFYKKYIKDYDQLVKQFSQKQGNYMTRITTLKNTSHCLYSKSWFTDTIEVPFENGTITISRDYDAFLKYEFGDYMTPPPPEARISHHFIHFIDLEQRYSISEIKRIIKQRNYK